jgi:hypothetical protein
MKEDNSVEKLMLDLIFGGHAGWAAAAPVRARRDVYHGRESRHGPSGRIARWTFRVSVSPMSLLFFRQQLLILGGSA